MPRQVTRALDKLKQPVRKAVLSGGLDRDVLDDEPILTGLSELQTKQALKVLDTYCANVQRQGSGRIQNKAAYLMSLIQSYKLGPAAATTGSAQRLMERLSPAVCQAVQAVFDPVVDRVVLEDRALMELLAKVPEEQALAALKKYRATLQRRGRDAIDNRCGYLIGFLKQYQDGVAVVGAPGSSCNSSSAAHTSRGNNASASSSNADGQHFANNNGSAASQSSSAANGHNSYAGGSRNGASHGAAVAAPSMTAASHATMSGNGGAGGGHTLGGTRPISYLQAPVRKELEKLFEAGRDKTVLEDVGLMKQLSRLGEEQALAALRNYKEASKHRRDIHNKSAYLMGILRGYIEGTTPISKAPWESGGSDEGPGVRSLTPPGPATALGLAGSRVRGRGRGPGPVAEDAEHSGGASSLPQSNEPPPQQPPPQQPPPQSQPPQPPQQQPPPQQQQQPTPQSQSPQPTATSVSDVVPSASPSLAASGPRELGGFTSSPVHTEQQMLPPPPPQPSPAALVEAPMATSSAASTSPLGSPFLGGDTRFLGGLGHSGVTRSDSLQHRFDPSNSLSYLDRSGAPQEALPHISAHESFFGNGGSHLSGNNLHAGKQPQPQPLAGPGLLGGEFLSSSDLGSSLSNPGLFGSGLLAGVDFASSSGNGGGLGHHHTVPASPDSGSGLGSVSGLGSSLLSGAGSGAESPTSSEAGNDAPGALTTSSSAAALAPAEPSLSVPGSSSYNGSTDWLSSSSAGSAESRENKTSNGNVNGNSSGNGVVVMLERLNLSKYVPVLAEAEVDLDALRLFGENDLKDLGFPKGPRIKLLHEVQNLNFPPRA